MNADRRIITPPWIVDTYIVPGTHFAQTHLVVSRLVGKSQAEHVRDSEGRMVIFLTQEAAQAEAHKRNAIELDALRRQIEREAEAIRALDRRSIYTRPIDEAAS